MVAGGGGVLPKVLKSNSSVKKQYMRLIPSLGEEEWRVWKLGVPNSAEMY